MTATSSMVTPLDPASARVAALEAGAWWRWLHHPVSASAAVSAPPGRVLLISYQFPPTGGSGVQRPAKLAKYLPACGWTVEVLAAGHQRFPWHDASLLDDVSDTTFVHRIPGHEPACWARRIASAVSPLTGGDAASTIESAPQQARWSARGIEDALFWRLTRWANRLGLDNGESMWIGPAARAAIDRHREQPFDAVISTGPPHFAHRVALRVAQTTGLPWLADLRDPLVSDFDRQPSHGRCSQRMRKLEADILQHAQAVVTTCPSFARDLQERYPDRAESINAITNGFDRDDILHALGEAHPSAADAACCEFVAAGSFYGRRELARIIDPLRQVLEDQPAWRHRVRLTVAGTIDAEQRRYWQTHAPAWVNFTGYLDHPEAIRRAARAACNLLVVPACEHGRLSIPGKTFELLALPVHVLALVPPHSDTAQIVTRAAASTLAPFESTHAVSTAMRQIIAAHLAGRLSHFRDWHRVDAFDRRRIAWRFAQVLRALPRPNANSTHRIAPRASKQLAAEVA